MIDKQLSLSDRPFNMSIFFPTAIKFERKFFSVLYGDLAFFRDGLKCLKFGEYSRIFN